MRRTPAMVTEPNVVPMIDVLLVLLIIYMIVGLAMIRHLNVQLPSLPPSPHRLRAGPRDA